MICTYVAFAFGLISIIAAFCDLLTISFYFWILNRFFDGLDGNHFLPNILLGFIARERK
jgi:phosphatidylserine synthase